MITTYSLWNLFRNCRRACALRYLQGLVPVEPDNNLSFGSLIHECLALWHGERNLEKVLEHINRAYPNAAQDEEQKKSWHLATAMMKGYVARYPQEDFQVVALNKLFGGKIINPATGYSSHSFVLAGKVNGIVQIGNEYFLLEHKTTSQLDSAYTEKLWTDFQVILYAWYVREVLGIPVAGIIYNILAKARLQQGKGETEAEFEARRAELLAKSKTGKTTAQRKLPESDEDFQQRLCTKYTEPEMFHREKFYIPKSRYDVLKSELWELTQNFLIARRRGYLYQNTAFCFHFQSPCAYYPVCSADNAAAVIENNYRTVDPHEELKTAQDMDSAFLEKLGIFSGQLKKAA
ncbi:MAG: PD-(D/E)XK nuclease family protein [Candidatus Schekmanbacteria bacterium]|nr:PD-(D/E)XK nuclease family protein [Candidatus Schekmanbacteria bacterium]